MTQKNTVIPTSGVMLPETGSAIERDGTAVALEVATAVAIYNSIYVNNPTHRAAVQAIVQVNALGLNPQAGLRAFALLVTGPSAAGKTAAVKKACNLLRSSSAIDTTLYVAIDVGATNRRIWSAILEALGDTFLERSSEENLRRRAYARLQSKGKTLVVFDEVQHLIRSSSTRDATDVFKRLLDDGIVSLVLVGTEAARRMFRANPQIGNRMIAPCNLDALSQTSDADIALFCCFLQRLDAAIAAAKLTQGCSNLYDNDIAFAIMNVSNGILGRAVNLIREALGVMVRREGTRIEMYDLYRATDRWAIPMNLAQTNPFLRMVQS